MIGHGILAMVCVTAGACDSLPVYSCPRVSCGPVIDGRLDEHPFLEGEAWRIQRKPRGAVYVVGSIDGFSLVAVQPGSVGTERDEACDRSSDV